MSTNDSESNNIQIQLEETVNSIRRIPSPPLTLQRFQYHLTELIQILNTEKSSDYSYLTNFKLSGPASEEELDLIQKLTEPFLSSSRRQDILAREFLFRLKEILQGKAPHGQKKSLNIIQEFEDRPAPTSLANVKRFEYGDEFKGFVCANPFVYAELRGNGDVATCCYLPFVLGNLNSSSLEDVWNSEVTQELRRSILSGKYSYCDKSKCAAMQQVSSQAKEEVQEYQIPYQLFSEKDFEKEQIREILGDALSVETKNPKIVSFEDDPSCNLECPSCRPNKIMIPREESDRLYNLEVALLDSIGEDLRELWICGAGDPFVSRSYRRLYTDYDFSKLKQLKIRFDTNGVALTEKTWTNLLAKVQDKIALIAVSIDAATEETYKVTRVGGNWTTLMQNLQFISRLPNRKKGMGFVLRMIVQNKNFREMKQFAELGISLGVDSAIFSVIQNWGTFSSEEYQKQAVHLSGHPDHKELIEILQDPIFSHPAVNLGNLTDLHHRNVSKSQRQTVVISASDNLEVSGRSNSNYKARAIAFYLPQFHPIPENDQWWGRGFTEWTNVGKAKPLFEGHYQPRVPADLGYYDLRLPEARQAQADLASSYGIEGFCYWHYWFAGKRLLQRPFQEVVAMKQPNFPFCLGWANSSWTGIWHGAPNKILIEQTYPGEADYRSHFDALLPAFEDDRYIKLDGKLLFLIYAPQELPNAYQFTELWRELAHKRGLPGFSFVAHMQSDPTPFGCDYAVDNAPFTKIPSHPLLMKPLDPRQELPKIHTYSDFVAFMAQKALGKKEFPLVMPNWDNTPRSNSRGIVLHDSTPELFKCHFEDAIAKLSKFEEPQQRVVFIKAWNEWAEGNYLEPDHKYGLQYLEALKQVLETDELSAPSYVRPQASRQDLKVSI